MTEVLGTQPRVPQGSLCESQDKSCPGWGSEMGPQGILISSISEICSLLRSLSRSSRDLIFSFPAKPSHKKSKPRQCLHSFIRPLLCCAPGRGAETRAEAPVIWELRGG